MAKHYSPRLFIRSVPTGLLREYFSTRAKLQLDWDSIGERATEPILKAWDALDPSARAGAEVDFADIHSLATDAGVRMLHEECANSDPKAAATLATHKGHHARSMWAFLNCPDAFKRALISNHAETLSSRYWKKIGGIPPLPQDDSPFTSENCGLLSGQIAAFYQEREGRGHRVTVEHHLIGGREHYVFAYPDDFATMDFRHDPSGKLKPSPVRRVFEVIYVLNPAERTLELYATGGKAVHAALVSMFGTVFFGRELALDDPARPAYDLNLLKSEQPFPTQAEDCIEDVEVTTLRLSVVGRMHERITFEAGSGEGSRSVYSMILDYLDTEQLPMDSVNVTMAKIRITFAPGGDRKKLTFEVSHPNRCDLKSRKEADRLLGEKYLKAWGIDRASK